jgi:dipeptidyl-peptidase-4
MKFINRIGALVVGLAGVCCGVAFAQSKLDLQRLYSLPWLIGTAPQDFVWSADSRGVAFLWNDEGRPFRDIWIASGDAARPLRVTEMPRPQMPADVGNDLQKMQQAADAEMDAGVSRVIWSADQRRLLFLFKGQLYAVLPGSRPELLTDQVNITSVKAAPKGNKIAFQSGSGVFVASVENPDRRASDVRKVGSAPLKVEEMYWSNDGQSLAFIEEDDSQVPRRGIPDYLGTEATLRMVKRPFPGEPSEQRRIGLVRAGDEGNVHWADLGGYPLDPIFNVAWSPDDKTLLVDKSDLYIKERRMLLVDAAKGTSSLLLREADSKNVTAEWWADWAPDGRGIYFTSDRENFYQVYYAARSGGEVRRITSGGAEIFSAQICGGSLFYISNEGKAEERHLHRVPLAGGASVQVTNTPGAHTTTVSPDGTVAADYFSSDLTPPDLYFDRLDGAEPEQRVTHSPLAEFKNFRWVGARYVTFPSTADGVVLHARLTLPPDFDPAKKYPAILGSVYSNTVRNQWGGRVAHPTWGLDQYLAQQGYVLLNVDIRGSSGYGKAFRQRLALDYGGIDVEDLYSGVKFLESQGYVDMQRVGMWGSSYGGLLTTMSLFKKPGVYKAGVAGAPATSLFHALTGEMRTMMAPQDHQQEYAAASAYLRSGGLQDHLMIIHGMRDEIVLFKDSVTLEQRLVLQGKDIQLVALPNAPHSWDTGPMAQTRYAYAQLISFFKRYLGEGPSTK